jgi:hypothetical protein
VWVREWGETKWGEGGAAWKEVWRNMSSEWVSEWESEMIIYELQSLSQDEEDAVSEWVSGWACCGHLKLGQLYTIEWVSEWELCVVTPRAHFHSSSSLIETLRYNMWVSEWVKE